MIRHILADGREVESIEGFVIPITGATAAVYNMVADFAKKNQEKNYKDKEAKANETA